MITIELPRALGPFAQGQTRITLEEPFDTVADALQALGGRSPGALDRVLDECGHVRPHVNVFIDGESIRFLNGLETPTPDGSSILIVAAVSGG